MKKLYEDYIFLVRTVLEGGRADDFSGDFEKLLELAREHNMTNILWYALRKTGMSRRTSSRNSRAAIICSCSSVQIRR